MQFKITKEFIETLNSKIEEKENQWILENIFELHHADIADVLDELSTENAKYVYYLGGDEVRGDILMDLQEENRESLIDTLSTKEIADQIENLDSDDAADILGEFSEDKIKEVISQMDDDEAAEDIVDLLNYDEDTAGGLMQKEFLVVQLNWPVNKAIMQLRKQAEDVERIMNIFVVDEGEHLLGVLSLKRLLIANSSTKIAELYNSKNIISVKTSDSAEQVSNVMEKYDLVSVPVVDYQNKLVGRITIDDVVDYLKEEADKDFQLATGISDPLKSDAGIWKISKARLPWLIIGLAGGILGAQVISGFEVSIFEHPELAFFIPLITAMGGNVGVQSSAIVVQSLARGDQNMGGILGKIWKETLVGMLNGILLSLIILGIGTAFGGFDIGLVVSTSLFTVIVVAAIFGTFIPLLLNKYKIDPALATGPFITTLNDVVGLFIYFSIGLFIFSLLK
ncbi:MAG: magnesium transporter [Crocinitomicaceae bacterium]|nr:magnesium transporter [Crocinitomicaceae bacterium]